MKKDVHFEVKEKEHTGHLTDEGVREAEQLAGVESFYTAGNMEWPHLIDNSLKAHHLYKRDVNYVVNGDGEVVIVDEFTGRLMPGRKWSDGLHQAVEAKEGVKIKEENQTLATITLQNFFKLYNKAGGMTGTAMTEADEFWKIYKLDVIAIPPTLSAQSRRDLRTSENHAIADESSGVQWTTEKARTRSSETTTSSSARQQTESIASKSQSSTRPADPGRHDLDREVELSSRTAGAARHQARGAQRQAPRARGRDRRPGRPQGAVTIATNMAGRGTDIILGGNPETHGLGRQLAGASTPRGSTCPQDEWDAPGRRDRSTRADEGRGPRGGRRWAGCTSSAPSGTRARRIDNPASRPLPAARAIRARSRFYLSLEDDLMRIFAGEWVTNVLTRLGMQEGEAIESRMVSPAHRRQPRRRSRSATSTSARTCSNTTR